LQACVLVIEHKESWLSVFSEVDHYFNLIKAKFYVDYLGKMSNKLLISIAFTSTLPFMCNYQPQCGDIFLTKHSEHCLVLCWLIVD
ncbi:hypothetical protein, partial [Methylobacter psychrophilus]|uniref:hypothetical protein n=1 Tax=Methylobacter psychrophilus TaxID=96941 RepID=UPI0021D4C669